MECLKVHFRNKKAQVAAGLRGRASRMANGVGDWLGNRWNNARTAGREEVTHSANMFVFFAIVVHLLKWSLNFDNRVTWAIDIGFAIVVLLFFFNRETRTPEIWRGVFIICLLEIFLPTLLGWNVSVGDNKFIRLYLLNRLLTPWWFYFSLTLSGGMTRFSRAMRVAVVIFWIGVILTVPAVGFSNLKSTYVGPEQTQAAMELWGRSVDFYKTIGTTTVNAIKGIPKAWDRQMDIATGGYYTGRVDENEKQPLGVYLENLKPAYKEFYTGEKASVWGTIKVKTLDDGIKVNLKCFAGDKDTSGNFLDIQSGKVLPENMPRIYDLEREDIDCSFDTGINQGMLKEGANRVTVQAHFNFETMAYLKTYFMDRDRMRSMATQGLDPLTTYGITDKNPVAVYTNGPIKIGMGLAEPPIGITSGVPTTPRLGITVESNTGWEGRIAKLKELIIQVPDSMSIDIGSCNYVFTEDKDPGKKCKEVHKEYRSKSFKQCAAESSLGEEDFLENGELKTEAPIQAKKTAFETCLESECKKESEGYKTYYLDTSSDPRGLQNIDSYKTFNCRVRIDNASKILGSTPVSTQYMRARARYDYVIEKTSTVNIKIDPAFKQKQEEFKKTQTQMGGKGDPGNVGKIIQQYSEQINKYVKENTDKNPELQNKLTYCLVVGIIAQESPGGDPNAVSKVGCLGLMQLGPTTGGLEAARDLGLENTKYDLFNIDTNIRFGTYYISKQLLAYKKYDMSLAAYNGGPTVPKACIDKGHNTIEACAQDSTCTRIKINKDKTTSIVPCVPTETRSYIPSVLKYKQICEEMMSSKTTLSPTEPEINTANAVKPGPVAVLAEKETSKDFVINGKLNGTVKKKSAPYYNELSTISDEYFIDLNFNGFILYQNLKLDKSSANIDSYVWDKRYPFARFKLNDKNITEFQYMEKSIKNVNVIKNNKNAEGKLSPVPVYENKWLGVIYDGTSLIFYDALGQEFCRIYWPPANALYEKCDGKPGFVVTSMAPFVENAVNIQVKYDPGYIAPCCTTCECSASSDCASCGGKCLITKKATYAGLGATDFICTKMTGTASPNNEEIPVTEYYNTTPY